MTERATPTPEYPGDPTTAPYWQAAREHRLLIQRCRSCGTYQFYPRPVCLACFTLDPEWVQASGRATVYSKTTVRIPVVDELEPPYVVGIVELEEGPRMTANLVGAQPAIGEPVVLAWRERGELPPLAVFERAAGGG